MSDAAPTTEMLQDYIDGRLGPRDEARIVGYLAANPGVAYEVERLRRLNSALSKIDADVLDEPIPDRLRQVLCKARSNDEPERTAQPGHHRRKRQLPIAVLLTAFAACIAGIAIGWHLRGAQIQPLDFDKLAIEHARNSYRLYADRKDYSVEFAADRQDQLALWIKERFEREVPPPYLGKAGFQFLGGRILTWRDRQSGFYLYENKAGERLSISFWPRTGSAERISVDGPVPDDTLATRFLATDGLGFAVLSPIPGENLQPIVEHLSAVYGK